MVSWCNGGQLSTSSSPEDVRMDLESTLGSSTYQLRLQFSDTVTDSDGAPDMVRFGAVKLVVEYTVP